MAAPPITERHKHHFHRRAPIVESVRFALTSNVDLATACEAGDSQEGLTLVAGDRFGAFGQTTGSQNGIYIVQASGAAVRAYDLSADDPNFGFLVYVREGSTNGDKVFKNTNASEPTIGTTGLTFSEFTGGVTDHGALTGLGDDDHPQYSTTSHVHAHSALTGVGADDHHARQHSVTSASDHTFPGGTTNFLRADGTFAAPPGASGGDATGQLVGGFSGGGSVPTAGATFDIVAPYDGTITGWTMLSDAAGDASIDVAEVAPGGSMPAFPADAITGSAVPAMTADDQVSSSTLTGWSTTIVAGHIYRFKLVSASTLHRVSLTLEYTR